MQLNTDTSVPVLVRADGMEWVPSPARGVERRLLFRAGGEQGYATSIVRYAPGSSFPRHEHLQGEEFLVLEGTFQDERGDYPPGTYVRNPPGSGHAPGSAAGCVLFVRLRQFRADDSTACVRLPGALPALLFESAYERVQLREWEPGAAVLLPNQRGLELLVVEGSLSTDEGWECGAQSWARLPAGGGFSARAGDAGVRLWWKEAVPSFSAGAAPWWEPA